MQYGVLMMMMSVSPSGPVGCGPNGLMKYKKLGMANSPC
jgi:hypothetical protein